MLREKKSVIDPNQCVGCGVCTQMCKVSAFESTEKEA